MPKVNDPFEQQHITNLAKYGRLIDSVYRKAAEEAAAIAMIVPNFDADKMFSFADYPITSERVKKLLNTLAADTQTVIVSGIDAEWTLANNKNNELARLVFGDNIGKLSQSQYNRYFNSNEEAHQAFLKRREQGLNLSDRVWRYTGMFQNDIEMGVDLGLRNGLSAAEMSRDLRQFLQHPDMLFRRVRDEHGNLVLSKRAAAYHCGQGVYRSSYMNARRLAVTETNIAFRTADFERIQQFDFVVGIEVCLSNNHNCKGFPTGAFSDICDELAGRYPKTFKFTGWHPHCRCHVKTVLKTMDEVMEETRAIMAGREPSKNSENLVANMPDNFMGWLDNNSERIEGAKTLPYFLRDNGRIQGGKYELTIKMPTTQPSPLDVAKKRHENRTAEVIAAIRNAWFERLAVRKFGKNVQGYMSGISDVDVTPLENALNGGDLSLIMSEAQKLKAVGKHILSLDKLDNPMAVARKSSMATAESVNANVTRTLGKMSTTDFAARKASLQYEINWVSSKGAARYPDTWMFARDAYKKELASVAYKLERETIEKDIAGAIDTLTKAKDTWGKRLIAGFRHDAMNTKVSNADLKKLADKIKARAAKIDAARVKNGVFVPKSDSETIADFVAWAKSLGVSATPQEVVSKGGFVQFGQRLHSDIYVKAKIETQAEHDKLWKQYIPNGGQRNNVAGYIKTGNSFKINSDFRETGIRDAKLDNAAKAKLKAHGATDRDLATIELLDKKIAQGSLPVPILGTRFVDLSAIDKMFPVKMNKKLSGKSRLDDVVTKLNGLGKNTTISDPAYLSVSVDEKRNVFNYKEVRLEIEIPPKTPLYLSNNFVESEAVLARNTKLELLSAKVDYDVVVIRCRAVQ